MDVGVIGVGTMGRNHVRVYTELKDVDNVYLYDVDGAAARRMSEQYGEGVEVSDSITSLLDTVGLVSICAPTKYHFELARQAVEMGIHCLIEKPICSTSEEAAQHLNLNMARIKEKMRTPVIMDGRNAYDTVECEQAGFVYKGVGKPREKADMKKELIH